MNEQDGYDERTTIDLVSYAFPGDITFSPDDPKRPFTSLAFDESPRSIAPGAFRLW